MKSAPHRFQTESGHLIHVKAAQAFSVKIMS